MSDSINFKRAEVFSFKDMKKSRCPFFYSRANIVSMNVRIRRWVSGVAVGSKNS